MNREQLNALLARHTPRQPAHPKRLRGPYGTAEQRFIRGHFQRHDVPVFSRSAMRAAFQSTLRNLRTEIAAGVPHRALLDRVDDELFKLDNRKP